MRAAEVASVNCASVVLCDAQSSFGRKFLIAGRGGLNLTHSEPLENFPDRYGAEQERWRDLLEKTFISARNQPSAVSDCFAGLGRVKSLFGLVQPFAEGC